MLRLKTFAFAALLLASSVLALPGAQAATLQTNTCTSAWVTDDVTSVTVGGLSVPYCQGTYTASCAPAATCAYDVTCDVSALAGNIGCMVRAQVQTSTGGWAWLAAPTTSTTCVNAPLVPGVLDINGGWPTQPGCSRTVSLSVEDGAPFRYFCNPEGGPLALQATITCTLSD